MKREIPNWINVVPIREDMGDIRASALKGMARAKRAEPASDLPDFQQPLYRELPEDVPFPDDALLGLQEAAVSLTKKAQGAPALCGNSVLAAASLVISPHYNVFMPAVGPRPIANFFLSIAKSSERKSTVDNSALQAIKAQEREWADQYEVQQHHHEIDYQVWERTTKRANKLVGAALKDSLIKAGQKPKPPPLPQILISNATPEGLITHFERCRPYAALSTAEGLQFYEVALSKDNKGKTAPTLNLLWDGETVSQVRTGKGHTRLEGRRLTINILIQPEPAEGFLRDPTVVNTGLLARLLIVAPDSVAGTRSYEPVSDQVEIELTAYGQRLRAFLERKLELTGSGGVLPRLVHLSEKAQKLLKVFQDRTEARIRPNAKYASIDRFAGKMGDHVCRLALVLAAFDDPDLPDVAERYVVAAIKLVEYYAEQHLRLTGPGQQGSGGATSPGLEVAGKLADWWIKSAAKDPGYIQLSLVDLYRIGPRSIRTASLARAILKTLYEHGWAKPLPKGTIIDCKPCNEAWELRQV